jgi:four helix bundle protein
MKMYVYSFERLEIWDDIRNLVKKIYKITGKFPDKERFGLSNQIQRAVISVSSNIAEGSSRTSYKDQAHYTQMAYGSLLEVISQLTAAYDLNYIDQEKYISVREEIDQLSPRIASLRNSQLRRHHAKR